MMGSSLKKGGIDGGMIPQGGGADDDFSVRSAIMYPVRGRWQVGIKELQMANGKRQMANVKPFEFALCGDSNSRLLPVLYFLTK